MYIQPPFFIPCREINEKFDTLLVKCCALINLAPSLCRRAEAAHSDGGLLFSAALDAHIMCHVSLPVGMIQLQGILCASDNTQCVLMWDRWGPNVALVDKCPVSAAALCGVSPSAGFVRTLFMSGLTNTYRQNRVALLM